MITYNLKIEGLHCASCKSLIEDVAGDVSGISRCEVDAVSGKTQVAADSPAALQQLVKEITALGEYRVTQV